MEVIRVCKWQGSTVMCDSPLCDGVTEAGLERVEPRTMQEAA